MKVGVLTYHHTTNYGATLQAYALCQFIQRQGHQVELIDYRPYKAVLKYWQALYLNSHWLINAIKSKRMAAFLSSEMSLSRENCFSRSGLSQWSRTYDLVVCGSDEIWNIQSFRGFDPSYFLDFVDQTTSRQISYAASFGFTKTLGEHQVAIQRLMQKFDDIAVRDSNSLDLLQQECGINAVKVLDPTWLADYSKITQAPAQQDYIVVYGGLSAAQQQYVSAIASKQNLPIISIGYPCKVAQINLPAVALKEWLGYIANANCVFTNFYHGAIFSMIFRKPFYVFSKADKLIKMQDLLNDLNLSDRIVQESEILNPANLKIEPVDYEQVGDRLKPMLQTSQDYLLKSLTTHQFQYVPSVP